jgi:hypothetical protein
VVPVNAVPVSVIGLRGSGGRGGLTPSGDVVRRKVVDRGNWEAWSRGLDARRLFLFDLEDRRVRVPVSVGGKVDSRRILQIFGRRFE